MKWENINLHLENLLPGLVTLAMLIGLMPADVRNRLAAGATFGLQDGEFVGAAILLAAAYMVGVWVNLVCRALIDRVSEWTLRPLLVYWLCKGDFPDEKDQKKVGSINKTYRKAINAATANDHFRFEVNNRRERGRLVRATLAPAILLPFYLFPGQHNKAVFVGFLAYVVVLFVYGYAEATIYEECRLALNPSKDLSHPSGDGAAQPATEPPAAPPTPPNADSESSD